MNTLLRRKMMMNQFKYPSYVVNSVSWKTIDCDNTMSKIIMTCVSPGNATDTWAMVFWVNATNVLWCFQRNSIYTYYKLSDTSNVTNANIPTWTTVQIGFDIPNRKVIINNNRVDIASKYGTPSTEHFLVGKSNMRIYKIQAFDSNDNIVDEYIPMQYRNLSGLYRIKTKTFYPF